MIPFGPDQRVVFFGAHTDDEMICAGTLHRLAATGAEVHVVTFGPAAIQSDRRGGEASVMVVEGEWDTALNEIGVARAHRTFHRYTPSVDLEKYGQDIADDAYSYVELWRPDIVFTLSPEDENPAHAVVGVQTERVLRGRCPTVIRCQFPWNYGIGRPNLYVSLGQLDVAAKEAVIRAYQSQHFRYAYDEMLLAYARADGLSVKVPYAEKFEVIRSVV